MNVWHFPCTSVAVDCQHVETFNMLRLSTSWDCQQVGDVCQLVDNWSIFHILDGVPVQYMYGLIFRWILTKWNCNYCPNEVVFVCSSLKLNSQLKYVCFDTCYA